MQIELVHSMTATFEGHAIADHFVNANKMMEYRLALAKKESLHNPDRLQEDE